MKAFLESQMFRKPTALSFGLHWKCLECTTLLSKLTEPLQGTSAHIWVLGATEDSAAAWKHWLGSKGCVHGFNELSDEMQTEMDVIVDDLLHEWKACRQFLEMTWHNLKGGGIFIIDNLQQQDVFKAHADLLELHTQFHFENVDFVSFSSPPSVMVVLHKTKCQD